MLKALVPDAEKKSFHLSTEAPFSNLWCYFLLFDGQWLTALKFTK
jgi:hypothetical protein